MAQAKQGSFGDAFQVSMMLILILYGVLLCDLTLRGIPLAQFGIVPRTTEGLLGVVLSPFLHASIRHLSANASSLLVLLTLLFWDRRYRPVETLTLIWLLSGLGTWLIGRADTVHVGASAIVYGLVIYLVTAAYWLRSWRCFFVGLVVLLVYGPILYGVFPRNGPVSWEAHLSGACVGLLVAKWQHGK